MSSPILNCNFANKGFLVESFCLFVLDFVFSTLNTSAPSSVACRVSAEKSADIIMGIPLYKISCFSLPAFMILLFLSLTFAF